VNKQVFQCFACKRRGNVLDFVAAVRGQDVHHAALWLREEFLVNRDVPDSVQEEGSRNGAGGGAAAAPLQAQEDAAPEDAPRLEALTEREAWLVDVVTTGIAWYLAEAFRPFSHLTSVKNGMVAKVQMAASGLSDAPVSKRDGP
jgi:hypothetical protein